MISLFVHRSAWLFKPADTINFIAATQPAGIPRVSPLWQRRPELPSAGAGMHRVTWNPLRPRPRDAPPSDEGGPLDRRYVGEFSARLIVNGKTYTQRFVVKPDPRTLRS